MASNAEVLAQLEKLAEGKLSGEMVSCYSHSRSAVSYYADLADFPAILAAARRWVKIEEAAEDVASEGSDVTISHLRAALKEPS